MIPTNEQIMKDFNLSIEELEEKEHKWNNNIYTPEEFEYFQQHGIILIIDTDEEYIQLKKVNNCIPPFEQPQPKPRLTIYHIQKKSGHGHSFRLPAPIARQFAKEILDFLGDEEDSKDAK